MTPPPLWLAPACNPYCTFDPWETETTPAPTPSDPDRITRRTWRTCTACGHTTEYTPPTGGTRRERELAAANDRMEMLGRQLIAVLSPPKPN